jgi:hypothetical protein
MIILLGMWLPILSLYPILPYRGLLYAAQKSVFSWNEAKVVFAHFKASRAFYALLGLKLTDRAQELH